MTIIEIEDHDGFHDIQSQSHRRTVWLSGYIAVPPALESAAWATGGYCNLTIEDGVLTGITPTERPEPEPEEPEASEVDTLKAQVADLQNQILTMRLGGI